MKIFKRRRMIGVAMVMLSMCLVTSGVQAEILRISMGSDSSECDSDGCSDCPQCKTRCKLEVTKGTEKKTCFKPECKTICIPRIRLPWQSCSEPRCAKTKTVKVLKKHSYECPKCEYKWTVVDCDDGCAEGGSEMPEKTQAAKMKVPTPPVANYRYVSDEAAR